MPHFRTKKTLAPLAALSILTLALSACGSGGSGEAGGGDADCSTYESYGDHEGTEVNVYSTIVDVEAERLENTWADFAECTGIEVAYEGSKEFETQIGVRAQAGNPPDLAIFPQPGLLASQAGNLKPAPQEVSDLVDEGWSEDWKKYGTVDGTFYAAPMLANIKGYVWYVPATFEEKGWEVPTTWDEMTALTETIASEEEEMKAWCAGFESGEATGWPGTDWVEDAVLRDHGPEVYDQWVTHEIPFNDPKVKEVAEMVEEIWFTEGNVLNGRASIASTGFGAAGLPILDGQCGMHRQANFYAAQFTAADPEVTFGPDGDVDAFYLPTISDDFGQVTLSGGTWVVAFNDDPDTLAAIEYMARAEFANARIETNTGGFISPNRAHDTELYSSPLDKTLAEILVEADPVRFDGSDVMPGEVGAGSFWREGTNWVLGTNDLDTFLDNVEASWPS